jgi:glycerol-3-phosphate dehydrogenase
VARVLPSAARVHPIAVYAGIRPLLAAEERVGEASREHHIVDDGPLLTIAGGKYTTFRVMARDVFVTAARKLKRATPPAEDGATALPAPLADGVRDEDLAYHAIAHEWAISLEDIIRRRSTRWLADDRGLAAARRMAPVLARSLGWDAMREKEEIDRFESSVRDELVMLDRALSAH